MKKFLSLILVLAFTLISGVSIIGCGEASNSLANNINQSINRIKSTLSNTEEISNEELTFNEIMTLDSNEALNKSNKKSNINRVSTKKTRNNFTKRINLPKIKSPIKKLSLDAINPNLNRLNSRRKSNDSRLTNSYYAPRRANSINYNNTGFVSYIGKIEDLYLMMNDAICTNDSINFCKNNILECCDILNILSGQLKLKEIKLADEEVDCCNDLLNDLGSYANKANSTRNNVKNECSALKQSAKNINFKVDQINTKYIKLINVLEERENNYKNILSILKQLQCVLIGNCYNMNELENSENIDNLNQDNLNKNKTNQPKINQKNISEKNVVENKKLNQTNLDNEKLIDERTNKNIVEEDNPPQNIKNIPYKRKSKDNNDNNVNKTLDSNQEKNENNLNQDNLNQDNKNIDTYKERTIKPNIIERRNRRENTNNEANQNLTNEIPNNVNQNPATPNNTPNINIYGYGANGGMGYPGINGNAYTPGGTGIVGNGIVGNGIVGGGIAGNGIVGGGITGNGIVGGGITGNGIIGGVGGVGIGGGYTGIHNYENGIINPFRNTDTYKLSAKPLPSETRKNFKPFTNTSEEIESKSFPLIIDSKTTEFKNDSEITKITYKLS